MAHVFISYCHQEPDISLAHTFLDALKLKGHKVFIDAKLRWGTDWAKEIRDNLEKADYLLVLLSRQAAASEMVAEEILIAKKLAAERDGKPIILPLRVRLPFSEPLPYDISAHLRSIQQAYWEEAEDTPELVDQLLATITDRSVWKATELGAPSPDHTPSGEPLPYLAPPGLIHLGGALAVDSSFYIIRRADGDVSNILCYPRSLVTIRGPRQTGKTSMILRVYTELRNVRSQFYTAFVDFGFLSHDDFQSPNAIWWAIANTIAEQLKLERWNPSDWQSDRPYHSNITRFLERFVFGEGEASLLVCLDEVDRVFNLPIKSEFFSSVRAFFNQGAIDPTWKKVRWLLGTSSEPSFFIENLSQSPFNVGFRCELHNFTPEEVMEFATRYGLRIDSATLGRIMDYVGGRPYLVHILLHHWMHSPEAREQLFDARSAGGGVFREHLHRFLLQFQREDALSETMKNIVRGIHYHDVANIARLEAAGLIHRDEDGNVFPLCELYTEFFKNELR